MMNNAVTAPALSSTWTCAPIELDRARVGVRASRFAAHHGAQHVSRCIMTPDICPSTASVQPSTLDSGEASIYVQLASVAGRMEAGRYQAHGHVVDHQSGRTRQYQSDELALQTWKRCRGACSAARGRR